MTAGWNKDRLSVDGEYEGRSEYLHGTAISTSGTDTVCTVLSSMGQLLSFSFLVEQRQGVPDRTRRWTGRMVPLVIPLAPVRFMVDAIRLDVLW